MLIEVTALETLDFELEGVGLTGTTGVDVNFKVETLEELDFEDNVLDFEIDADEETGEVTVLEIELLKLKEAEEELGLTGIFEPVIDDEEEGLAPLEVAELVGRQEHADETREALHSLGTYVGNAAGLSAVEV